MGHHDRGTFLDGRLTARVWLLARKSTRGGIVGVGLYKVNFSLFCSNSDKFCGAQSSVEQGIHELFIKCYVMLFNVKKFSLA